MPLLVNDTTPAFIRQVRQRAGLSLRRVAARCGITAPYLYDLEMGHRALNMERRRQVLEAIRVMKDVPETVTIAGTIGRKKVANPERGAARKASL